MRLDKNIFRVNAYLTGMHWYFYGVALLENDHWKIFVARLYPNIYQHLCCIPKIIWTIIPKLLTGMKRSNKHRNDLPMILYSVVPRSWMHVWKWKLLVKFVQLCPQNVWLIVPPTSNFSLTDHITTIQSHVQSYVDWLIKTCIPFVCTSSTPVNCLEKQFLQLPLAKMLSDAQFSND